MPRNPRPVEAAEWPSALGPSVRFRRAQTVVSYWLSRVLVFENYLARTKLSGDPILAAVLHFCCVPRCVRELAAAFPEIRSGELQHGVRTLLRYALLEVYPRKRRHAAEHLEAWNCWSPGAAYFHFSTKDVQYPKRNPEEFGDLRRIAAKHALPELRKHYSRVDQITLPSPRLKGEFVSVLSQRRTWREFSSVPVDLRSLSELLWLAFGVQGSAHVPEVGRFPLTTSPSGGCLHPLEAYVVACKVFGLSPAVYHYDSVCHQLVRVAQRVSQQEVSKFLGNQDWSQAAAFVVVLTAVFERTQWKYKHPRAYRVVLAEAGHLCQTFCLTATWLGLAPFCTMALADSQIERRLGVDGIGESVLYAMGAGHRPERAATADRLRIAKELPASKTRPR